MVMRSRDNFLMGFSLQLFTDLRFVWACVGFLTTLALVTGALWLWRCRQAITALKKARITLAGSSGQTEFAADYHGFIERIRGAVRRVPAFHEAWERWERILQSFQRADGKQVISAEKPASDFFTLAAWERSMAMHWYRALPNYLVGLGLCCTFLGVVAVIQGAATSLQTAQHVTLSPEESAQYKDKPSEAASYLAAKVAAMQTEALRSLLDAASFKFVTSLVGVAMSLAYSLFFRWRRINVERHIADLVADLNRRVFMLNPTALLLQIREENQHQTGCLETMATNVGVAVGEQFTKATQVMGDALSRLEATVQAMGAQMGEKTDAMKQAIDGMSGGIVETTSKDLEKLVTAAVELLNTTLKQHLEEVANALKDTGVEIEAARLAFGEVLGHARVVRGEYATLAEEIQARTSEVSELLLKAEGEVETRLRGAVTAAEEIQTALGKAAESASGMDSLGAGLAKAASAVESAATNWQTMGEDFSKLTLANGNASETVRAAMESLRAHWEAQGARIGEIDTHLAATIGAVQQHFDGYALRLREYTTELDSQLGRAVGSFSAVIESLSDAPERFGDAGAQLQKAAQNAMSALEPLRKLDGLAAAISKSADALRAAIPEAQEPQP